MYWDMCVKVNVINIYDRINEKQHFVEVAYVWLLYNYYLICNNRDSADIMLVRWIQFV